MNYFMQQELEAEFNAQFDYVREANFGMVESLSALAAEERDREREENNYEMDAMVHAIILLQISMTLGDPTDEAG